MSKYHVNSKGETGKCSAKTKCPFGGETGVENHFSTEKEARAFYETTQTPNLLLNKTYNDFVKKDIDDLKKSVLYTDNMGNEKNILFQTRSHKLLFNKIINGKVVSDKSLDKFIEDRSFIDIFYENPKNEIQKRTVKSLNILRKMRNKRGTPNTLSTPETFNPKVETVFSNPHASKHPVIMENYLNNISSYLSKNTSEVISPTKKIVINDLEKRIAEYEAAYKEYLYVFNNSKKNKVKADETLAIFGYRNFIEDEPIEYNNFAEKYPNSKNKIVETRKRKFLF